MEQRGEQGSGKSRVGRRRRAAIAAGISGVAAFAVALALAFSPLSPVSPGPNDGDAFREIALEDLAASPDSGNGTTGKADDDSAAAAKAAASVVPATFQRASMDSDEGVPELTGAYESDVVVAQLPAGWTADEVNAQLSFAASVEGAAVTDEDLARGFAELPLTDGFDVAHAVAELQQLPAVTAAQPNYLYTLADDGIANDQADSAALAAGVISALREDGSELVPTIVTQATTTLNDTYASQQWALSSIYAYDAWDVVRAGDAGEGRVSVAVLDNGFLVTHEDLAGNILATYNTNDGGTDVSPIYGGHGTHVCGIISAVANNEKGVAGVSYNAGLVPIQVFNYDTWKENGQTKSGVIATSTRLYAAYQYIMDSKNSGLNIRVVNMSLGGAMDANANLGYYDNLLVSAVNSAFNRGILTVCAAGNDAGGVAYSAFPVDWLDNALGVIALENGTPPTRPDYSNYNTSGQTTKDISAPGSAIYSTYAYTSSTATDVYASIDGTSMASPCVAGVAALVFAANEDLSASDVASILCSTATDLGTVGWDEGYGAGEVNAYGAVQAAAAVNLIGNSIMLKGGTTTLVPSRSGSWTWKTSDAGVASVSSDGVVTGIGAGTATITATSGTTSASKAITVYDISFSGPSEVNVGSWATLTFNENPDTELWYVGSADRSIAEVDVDSTGTYVYGVAPGTTTIRATSASNSNLVVEYPFTVIDISGNDAVLAGAQTTFVPTAGDGLLDDEWQWSTSDASVATVSSDGIVTGVSAGTATITATSPTRSLSKGITVYEASLDGDDEVRAGSSITLTFMAAPTDTGATWAFSSSNAGVASVADNGDGTITVTGLSAGTVDIVASLDGVDDVSVSHGVEVLASDAQFSLRENRVSISWPTYASSYYYYSGQAKEPEPQVTYRSGTGHGATSTILTKDEDYILTYDENVDAGTAYVYVTGIGDYKDTRGYTFTIKPYPVDGAYSTSFFFIRTTIVPAVSVSGLGSVTYTGRAHTPEPTLSINDGAYTLVKDTDYTLSYANNTNAGTATITVKGQGNFSSSGTTSFTIAQADFSTAQVAMNGWTYDGTAHTSSANNPVKAVTLGGRTLSADEYSVAFSGNKNAGTCTATVSPTDTANYAGTATGTCTVAKRSVTLTSASATKQYDGTALTAPDVTIGGNGFVTGEVSNVRATGSITNMGSVKNAISYSTGSSFSASNYEIATTEGTLTVTAAPGKTMFRLYNPNSGEHFYTASTAERDSVLAAGWNYEGVGWTAPSLSATPVYRLYNKYGGEHHYTTSSAERDSLVKAGWNDEGIGWYSDDAKTVPLYRVYNPNAFANNHHYTTSASERDWLISLGWKNESIGWYGV